MASCKNFGPDYAAANEFIDQNCDDLTNKVADLKDQIDVYNQSQKSIDTLADQYAELAIYRIPTVPNGYETVDVSEQFNNSLGDLTAVQNAVKEGLDQAVALESDFDEQTESPTFEKEGAIDAYLLIQAELEKVWKAGKGLVRTWDKLNAITSDLDAAIILDIAADPQVKAAGQEAYDKAFANSNLSIRDGRMEAAELARREAERKKRAELKAALGDVANIASLTANENYLSKPFREQCYIQSNIFELINLRRSPDMPKKAKLPNTHALDGRPQSQACVMAGGSPFGFINKLTQSESIKTMFEIPPEILSQLQPTVRLFKIVPGAKAGTEEDVEITFQGSTTADDVKEMLSNKKRRGLGVGLKSFNWTYDGSDPFSTKKSIKAKLKLHAASFADLLAPRGLGRKSFRYVDLALKTGSDSLSITPACRTGVNDTIVDASSKLNFRLKVLVGYAIPRKLAVSRGDATKIENAIRDSFVTLELTPTIHEFEFDEFGRVNLVINYLAYIEDFFDDFYYDIFAVGEKASKANFERRMKKAFDAVKKKEKPSDQPKEEEDPEILKAEQMANLKSLLSALFKSRRIYYYKIPYAKMTESMYGGVLPVYDTDGGMPNRSAVTTALASLRTQAHEAEIAGKTAEATAATEKANTIDSHLSIETAVEFGSDTYEQVTFFYLYDLIDIILDGINVALKKTYPDTLNKMTVPPGAEKIKAKEIQTLSRMQTNFKKLRVLLGPLEISNPRNPNDYINVSIGEIPISVKYFTEWMASKVIAKSRTGFTLSAFISQFVKNYLRNFLNDNRCGGDRQRQRASLYNSSVTSYWSSASDEISSQMFRSWSKTKEPNKRLDYYIPKFTGKGRPVLNTMGSRERAGPRTKGQDAQRNWMIFYAGRSRPQGLMSGDYASDQKNGIFHYVLGSDKGVVKTIKLDRTSATGLKEIRFEQEGYDGLMQLREVYNVTVEAFLMPNTFPGTYMYVDPRGFAPSTKGYTYNSGKKKMPIDRYELSRYGIGGYYMIIKTTHTIAEGVRSSQIIAHWVAEIDKTSSSNDGTEAAVDSNPEIARIVKCASKRTEHKVPTAESSTVPVDDVGADPNPYLGPEQRPAGLEGIDSDLMPVDELIFG